jgi:predicted transposase YdaD
LEYEVELCKANKMSEMILAATLIMSNKILDDETLNKIWKEVKMIDIFAFAHEKGRNEGKKEGRNVGRGEGIKDSLFTILEASIGKIPENITDKINKIAQESTLLELLKVAPRCKGFGEFELALA